MKIKLDENMPELLRESLAGLGHDVHTVKDEGLAGKDDPMVWKVAQQEGRFVITHDLYFADIRHHPPGTHHGVLLLRLPAADRDQVTQRVLNIFSGFPVETWNGFNVVATNEVVRVRRP